MPLLKAMPTRVLAKANPRVDREEEGYQRRPNVTGTNERSAP